MNRKDIFNNDRLQALLKKNNLDIILISSRHNVRYLTGGYFYPLFMWDTNTRETQYLPFIGIPEGNTDESFMVGRPGEVSVANEAGIWITDCTECSSIGTVSAAAAAAAILKKRGLQSARIGVELSSLPSDAYICLLKELPGAEFINITALLDTLRAVKNEREIDIIRKGTLLNLSEVNKALRSAKSGMSTKDIADVVEEGFRHRGIHFLYALVCAGPAFFRAASDKRHLISGGILHIDSGALTRGGYIVETCRTGSLGKPSGEADEMLGLCTRLEKHMLPFLRPGVSAAEIQIEADSFVSGLNAPFEGKFIAHGIGMVHHEKPVINTNSSEYLESGMVLSLEMEFKSEKTGHVKTEDMVVIRQDECEILSPGGDEWTISE